MRAIPVWCLHQSPSPHCVFSIPITWSFFVTLHFLVILYNITSLTTNPILFTSPGLFNPFSLPPQQKVNPHYLAQKKIILNTSLLVLWHNSSITVTFSETCFLVTPSVLPRLLVCSIHNASPSILSSPHFPLFSSKRLARLNCPMSLSLPHSLHIHFIFNIWAITVGNWVYFGEVVRIKYNVGDLVVTGGKRGEVISMHINRRRQQICEFLIFWWWARYNLELIKKGISH